MSCSFVRHEISPSSFSREPFDRESPNFTWTSTDIVCSHTGFDVIIYFQSEVLAKELSKILPPTASGGICRERFKQGSLNFINLSRTICLINLPDKTSPAASSRLQNAIKYCTKVCKTSPVGQSVHHYLTESWKG